MDAVERYRRAGVEWAEEFASASELDDLAAIWPWWTFEPPQDHTIREFGVLKLGWDPEFAYIVSAPEVEAFVTAALEARRRRNR